MKRTSVLVLVFALALVVLAGQAAFAADEDFVFDAATGTISQYKGFDTELVIPAAIGGKSVKVIGANAFKNAGLTSVTIPNGIIVIGNYAFRDNKLTDITIPGSVTMIGNVAFGNNQLTSVVLSEGVQEVGDSAFSGNKLTSISFPSTLVKAGSSRSSPYEDRGKAPETVILAANVGGINTSVLGEAVFYNYIANDRKAGTYTQSMPNEKKTEGEYEYRDTQYGAVIVRWNSRETRARVPAELEGKPVKAIDGADAFGQKNLVAVQLPDSLTYIGYWAFIENQLTSVTIPAGVTYIGDSAFNRNQLTSVTIPAGVTYIGDSAFENNKLTSLSVPASVKFIGSSAFQNNGIGSLTLARGLTYIGTSAFASNKLTGALTVPAGVTYIGADSFSGAKLTVTLPSTVTRLQRAPVGREEGNIFILQGDALSVDSNGNFTVVYKAGRYTWGYDRNYRLDWQWSAR